MSSYMTEFASKKISREHDRLAMCHVTLLSASERDVHGDGGMKKVLVHDDQCGKWQALAPRMW
jgi:hypothetical protein